MFERAAHDAPERRVGQSLVADEVLRHADRDWKQSETRRARRRVNPDDPAIFVLLAYAGQHWKAVRREAKPLRQKNFTRAGARGPAPIGNSGINLCWAATVGGQVDHDIATKHFKFTDKVGSFCCPVLPETALA